jgi:YidC/Oxa1 family membrane protein insertase
MPHELIYVVHLALGATNPLHQIFGPFVDLLRSVLRSLEHLTGSWGLAIILLTVIVRLFLMPLTFKQYRSAQAMQQLQPKIKELQRKYKGDKRKLQEETMKLYQEYRVNPFASCLPLLIQLPVFICLYYAIRGTPEIKQASFLFIPSLGQPWLPLFVFYIITQMVSTELMMTPESDPQQKWLMRAMPVVFIFILYRFPAGLMLYWVTTNLWTIGQQIIIKRTAPKHQLQPAGAKPPGRFMRAMMLAQEQRPTGDGATRDTKQGSSKSSGGGRPGGRPPQRRAGGNRPPGKGKGKSGSGTTSSGPSKGGTQRSGKGTSQGTSRPSGASDGRKRKPTS